MCIRILLKKYLYFSTLIVIAGLFTVVHGQENADKKLDFINLTISVVDEQGEPVKDAMIKVGKVDAQIFTNNNGNASFETINEDFLIISKIGYADFETLVGDLNGNYTVQMKKQGLYLSSKDNIELPFMTMKKRYSTSSSQVIYGEDLERYPTTDIRNSFSGLALGLQVIENNGMPDIQPEENIGVYTDKISLLMRGRNPIYIIDDIPTDVTEIPIDPQEIESVTVIKDIVGKAMYGPQAADGIIFIKTRRGNKQQNILKVNAEMGTSIVDKFPEWTLGADYAKLNNQARMNSGREPLYSESDIQAYAKNNAYDMYHPSTNFRDMILQNVMPMQKANISYEGGKKDVQFFTYLGYSGNDDLFKIGPAADFKRLNSRSNLDISINETILLKLNIYAGLTFRNSPQYASGYLSKFNLLLDDINTTPPIAFPVYADKENDWYGVDPLYDENPVGAVNGKGYYTEYGRNGSTNLSFNWDLKNIVKGLKSTTYLNFDVFNLVRIGKQEQYAAYNVIPSKTESGADTILLTKSMDAVDVSGQSNLHDYYYQRFGGYQNFSYSSQIGSNSSFQSSLTYLLSQVSRDTETQPERMQSLGLTGLFTHNDKYSITGVLNYSGSSRLASNNRYALFPSIGFGWIVSDENFFADVSFIKFLKLRGEAGILGYETFGSPFLYKDRWTYNTTGITSGPANTGYWFGSDNTRTTRSYPDRIGNPDLGWEKRKEFTLGFDALLFDNLALEINYYNNTRDGIITNLSYTNPYVTGNATTDFYDNFNKVRYFGWESNITYTGKTGGLRYSVGTNLTVQDSKVLQWDEPNYRFDYQSRVGKPAGAYWGHTYLGKFISDADAQLIPQIYDDNLLAGDLKYEDKNNDGLVDDNDISMVGNTTPKLYYALNIKLNYKNFDLTMIADGRAFVDLPLTNSYFQNGWGDNNYSNFVKENINGAYPRLTYNQVSNNFQRSDFWLTNGGYFKIQNVELAYTFSSKIAHSLYLKGVRLFIRGANLLTITDVKYVDPESPDAGVSTYPLYKTFSGGIKINF